ncbi:MAG: TPR domain protein, putative component of TonB system [Chloroflexi bacterium AL-W]|nr:TPR domain protein, putative component of TonB system [Chloroflexi bacterium AL-N1]NOK70583.1 TPR domain protein, putative component of TonB system [Chloroflexi bacterium AL-N10]NOK77575.1 TPR domain protein, putative component of TonB system [Chloroflexi bacterium AL-N5]NOK84426.1 TPR domain protein, putative component of TonB system [Chloroflexi bacterium AL-W]NOK92315.1 TPR domain protein, putative component of TonB system [Chloroflexi bacterium AL-N15]
MLYLLIFVIILVCLGVGYVRFRPEARKRVMNIVDRFRKKNHPKPTSSAGTVTVIQDGEEIQAPIQRAEAPQKQRLSFRTMLNQHMRQAPRTFAIATVILVSLVALWLVPGLLPAPADQFVVIVAPFQDPDGQISQSGRTVARQLADQLPTASGNRVTSQFVNDPPGDPNQALRMLERYGADALIWGEIEPGGILNQESLRPLLAYQSNGAFAPAGWDGYVGRFTMPTVYTLSTAPINGQVVLPDLLGALADYGNGESDAAFATLGQLIDDYPALSPVLTYAVRGNVLWARGEYTTAAEQYRRTGVMEAVDESSQMALLANNLGAILQDANDSDAQEAFRQAAKLLGGRDLVELRLNWGIEHIRLWEPEEAISQLEAGRNLLERELLPTSFLLTLAEAYRMDGQFTLAQQSLDRAELQVQIDSEKTTPDQRNLVTHRLRAHMAEEQAKLTLAQALDVPGRLDWSLQRDETLFSNTDESIDILNTAQRFFDESLSETELLMGDWGRRAAAEDAAENPITSLVATGQSRRAEIHMRERQRWQAITNYTISQTRGIRGPEGFAAFWAMFAGDQTPVGRSRTTLQTLVETQSEDIDSRIWLGRTWRLSGELEQAREQFITATELESQRPEPWYHQALVELPRDRAEGWNLLEQAIDQDSSYYPARKKLAEVAIEDQQWAVALEQCRWLAREQSSDSATVTLAHVLRLSGPSGYVEAEQLLLPLANINQVDALLELNQLYQANGQIAAAMEALQSANQVSPNRAEIAYEMGNLYVLQESPAEAETQYRRAIDLQPLYVEAHLALGQLYTHVGRLNDAAQEYRAALDAGTSDPDELKQIGIVLLANNEVDSAISAFERARDSSPEDPEVYYHLGRAHIQDGQLATAQEEVQQAIELRNGMYPEAHAQLGDIALIQGDFQMANEEFNIALDQNPTLVNAHIGLGRVAGAQGNWAVAQGHFQNAIAQSPESAQAHLWLGEALVRQDRGNDAIAAYNHTLELVPNYPEAYFGLAQAQAAEGQLAEASTNIEQALFLQPNYADALLLHAKVYEQQDQVTDAIQAYGDTIEANEDLAEPRYRRALLYIRTDRIPEARDDLERAVRLQPNFPEAHYWLGRTYLIDNRAAIARDQFEQAVEQRGGNYPEARFYQGVAEEQLGQRDNAITSFRIALQQGQDRPWSREAQAALTRLESQ